MNTLRKKNNYLYELLPELCLLEVGEVGAGEVALPLFDGVHGVGVDGDGVLPHGMPQPLAHVGLGPGAGI